MYANDVIQSLWFIKSAPHVELYVYSFHDECAESSHVIYSPQSVQS